MADRAVMIALGTKLGPQQGAAQQRGIIAKLQAQAANLFGGKGAGGVLAGGLAGGVAGAMVGLAQGAASKFGEAFEAHLQNVLDERRFKAYFGQLAPLASEWAKEFSAATQYAADDVGVLMGQVYNMGRGLGMTTRESADLSKQVTQLSLDFAAFNGMKPEEAFLAIEAAMAGQTRSLMRYGIVFSQTEKEVIEKLRKTGDEAAVAAKMMELLGQKMGAMKGAAEKNDTFKEMREYQLAVKELKEGLGSVGEFFVKSAVGWKYIIEGASKISPVMVAFREARDWFRQGTDAEAGEEQKAAANRARLAMEAQNAAEDEARRAAAAAQEAKLDGEQRYFEALDAGLKKLKELNEAAESGSAAALQAAEEQAKAVDRMMGREGSAANIQAVKDAEELRARLKKGEYDDILAKKAADLLKMEEDRLKKAKELVEARRKEGEKLAEQFGMMGALERAQAKSVLERLQKGGYEAYKDFGEKEVRYAREFAPEKSREYARRLTGEYLGADLSKELFGKVEVKAALENKITAELSVDGPSIAQQITERVLPKILELLNNTVGVFTGRIGLMQSSGQAVAGAAAQ